MTRCKLTRERRRVLGILASGDPVALVERRGVDQRVVRSLERWTLIRRIDADHFALTPRGADRLARYRPRHRSGTRHAA